MTDQNLDIEGFPLVDPFNDPSSEFDWFDEALRWNDWHSPDDALNAYWDNRTEWNDWDDCNGWDNWDDWTEYEISAEESYYIYCESATPAEMASSDCLREEISWKNISDDVINKLLIANGFKKPHSSS